MKVAVIGGGSFGTALACAARRAGLSVSLWAREAEVVESINAGRDNPLFLKSIALQPGITAHANLADAAAAVDFVLLAVPAQFLRIVSSELRAVLAPGVPVVSCSKGIERQSCALMPEVIADVLPGAPVAVLAGPSFAAEVTLACIDDTVAARLAGAMSSAHFRVYTSNDPVAATIGGAYKNVLAIACGISIARNMGENIRGLLIARGFYEMARIVLAKGGNPVNLLGLAGSGDVTLTCMGTQSRNTSFGIALGKGRSAADVLAERKVVTEGVHNAASITELGRRLGVSVPIVSAVNAIVNEGLSIDAGFDALLAQPTGSELGKLLG
jgi:glycerol-3-phosphate dehydrogenase (NAD(P)+)